MKDLELLGVLPGLVTRDYGRAYDGHSNGNSVGGSSSSRVFGKESMAPVLRWGAQAGSSVSENHWSDCVIRSERCHCDTDVSSVSSP